MIVSTTIQKMIEFYKGNLHEINHFVKVWAMAKTIGELEGLDAHAQEVLELTAVVHDYQILLEADFLVNADEGGSSRAAIEAFRTNVFRTAAGLKLLDSIYLR